MKLRKSRPKSKDKAKPKIALSSDQPENKTEKEKILIDVGVSCKKIETALKNNY